MRSRIERAGALVGCMLVLSIAACGDPATAPQNDPRAAIREALTALGFPSDSFVDLGEDVAVGDILVSKVMLSDKYALRARQAQARPIQPPNRPNYQWLAGGGGSSLQGIAVNVSELGATAGWADATRAALGSWSTIAGADLNLYETEGSANVLVTFTSNVVRDCGQPVIACAYYPVSGSPGRRIYISRNFDSYTPAQKHLVMVHELGHTLGLKHSDWQTQGESSNGALLIPSTPSTDDASVMNARIGGSNWTGFSFFDQRAASEVYRSHFPIYYDQAASSAQWDAQLNATSYAVYYYQYYEYVDQDGNIGYGHQTFYLGTTSDNFFTIPDQYIVGVTPCSTNNTVRVVANLASGGVPDGSTGVSSCPS